MPYVGVWVFMSALGYGVRLAYWTMWLVVVIAVFPLLVGWEIVKWLASKNA